MNKFKFEKRYVILSLIIIGILCSNVSALQEYLTIKECLYSLNNDGSFTEYWNETTQSGIFLNVTNLNRVLGINQNPNYTYTTYQSPRSYYNNFYSGGEEITTIPVIPVNSGKENKVYAKCTFISGARLYFGSIRFFAGSCSSDLFLTHDLNLTEKVIGEGLEKYLSETSVVYNNSNFTRYTGVVIKSTSDAILLFNNTIDSPSNSVSTGFYQNTEPVVITRIDIDSFPSGLLSAGPGIYGNSGTSYLSPTWSNSFYINSTTKNISDYLMPRIVNATVRNNNTGVVATIMGAGAGQIGPKLGVNYGDKLEIVANFKNDFGSNLTNKRIYIHVGTDITGTTGVGASGTDLINFGNTTPNETYNHIFGSYEEKSFSYDVVIPRELKGKNVSIGNIGSRIYIGGGGWGIGGSTASDNETYLGLGSFFTDIKYSEFYGGGVFDLRAELYLFKNVAPYTNPIVFPGDYDLLVEIYHNNSGNEVLVKEEIFPLNGTAFEEMGITNLTGGNRKNYTIVIPIEDSWKENLGRYYVKVYTVKRTEPFKDLKIATLNIKPYFEQGPTAYITDPTFYVYNNSRIDTRQVTIFNPTFETTNISLDISENLENYSILYPSKVELRPAESKVIFLVLNATHDSWPKLNQTTEFTLTSSIGNPPGNTIQTLKIKLISENSNWTNLEPSSIVLNKTEEIALGEPILINASWLVRGSDSGLLENKNKRYNVSIEIYNSSGVKHFARIKEYNIFEEVGINYPTESWVETFHTNIGGNYTINLSLDISGEIDENKSSGSNGEVDNNLTKRFEILDCIWNETIKDFCNTTKYIEVSYELIYGDQNRCGERATKQLECPKPPVAIVPFFSFSNFIASLFAIIFVYYFFRNKL